MADFILGHNDIGYQAGFTGGTWDSNLDIDMLNRELITAIAETTTDTPFDLDVTLTSNINVGVLGLVNHNLTATGTYQWRGYSDSGRTTLVYDSGAITAGSFFNGMPYKTSCLAPDTAQNLIYWRLSLSDSGNPDGAYKLGRVFIGERFYPNRNMAYGLQFGVQESNSELTTSQFGIETFVDAPNKRTVQFSFEQVNYSQGNEFLKFSMSNGIIGACLFEFDPDDKQEGIRTFICRQESLNPLDFVAYNINNIAINLVEII